MALEWLPTPGSEETEGGSEEILKRGKEGNHHSADARGDRWRDRRREGGQVWMLLRSPPESHEWGCEDTRRSLIITGPRPSILTRHAHILSAEAPLPGTLHGLFLAHSDFIWIPSRGLDSREFQ